jgi:hypothetical protein
MKEKEEGKRNGKMGWKSNVRKIKEDRCQMDEGRRYEIIFPIISDE